MTSRTQVRDEPVRYDKELDERGEVVMTRRAPPAVVFLCKVQHGLGARHRCAREANHGCGRRVGDMSEV